MAYVQLTLSTRRKLEEFYGRYVLNKGTTIAEAKKRVSKLDIEAYGRKAEKYVREKNFSKQANAEMRIYNLTMKVNRLEMLKANIGLELVSSFDELEKMLGEKLTERTLEEFERQAGILGATVGDASRAAAMIVGASFYNATFSQRIWANEDMLKSEISRLLQRGMIQGKNPKVLAAELRKSFDVSRYETERLMRTEMARVQIEAQKMSYERGEFEEYEYMTCHKGDACDTCKALDGKHFKVKDMMPGGNAPPMHPNCHCSTCAYLGEESYFDEELYNRWLDTYKEHRLGFKEWRESSENGRLKANNSGEDNKAPTPLRVGALKDLSEENIRKTLYAWEKKIESQEFESAIVITKVGDIYKIDGNANSVNINGLSSEQLSGAWMTHNHPASETYYSFSAFDISEALRNRFSLLRGTDVVYNYEYRTIEKTMPGEFDKIFNLFGETYRNKAYEAALNGEINIDVDEYDFICKMLAKDYEFYYERKKK